MKGKLIKFKDDYLLASNTGVTLAITSGDYDYLTLLNTKEELVALIGDKEGIIDCEYILYEREFKITKIL